MKNPPASRPRVNRAPPMLLARLAGSTWDRPLKLPGQSPGVAPGAGAPGVVAPAAGEPSTPGAPPGLGTTLSWSEETSEFTVVAPRVFGTDAKNTTGVFPVPVSTTSTAPFSVVQVAPWAAALV